MSDCFPSALQLRCFNHVRRNVKDKLQRDLELPPAVASEILQDIFGWGDIDECLANAINSEKFMDMLVSFAYKWNSLERKHGRQDQNPSFHQWFSNYKAENFIAHMIWPIREKAGLGNPPKIFLQTEVNA